MFDLLLESRPVGRVRPWSGGVVALAAHATIIFSIVRVAQQPTPRVISIALDTFPTYGDPRPTRPTVPTGPSLPVFDPSAPVIALESLPKIATTFDLTPHVDGLPGAPSGPEPVGLGSGSLSDVIDAPLADERPELLAAPPPRYPDLLREAGIEGHVLVRAIVDTLGRAEPGSIHAVASTHSGFEAAAVACVRQARFRPARVGGRAVRVLVEIPVDFRIHR